MLVVMKNDATEEQVQAVIKEIEKMGYRGVPMPGAQRTAICIIGNKGPVEDYAAAAPWKASKRPSRSPSRTNSSAGKPSRSPR